MLFESSTQPCNVDSSKDVAAILVKRLLQPLHFPWRSHLLRSRTPDKRLAQAVQVGGEERRKESS